MFSERLRRLRRERGISQERLADAVSVSGGAVGNWEAGIRRPDHVMLQRLADFFNVSTDYLLGRTDVKEPIETIALHRSDGYDEDLPEEAKRSIEEFKEFVRRKYRKGKDDIK